MSTNFEQTYGGETDPTAIYCEARGCERVADLAYIGEGGDMYLCDFHGGAGEVDGWVRIKRDPGAGAWRCLRSIMDECEGYRFGQDSYDPKLDHIYEEAASALGYLDDAAQAST